MGVGIFFLTRESLACLRAIVFGGVFPVFFGVLCLLGGVFVPFCLFVCFVVFRALARKKISGGGMSKTGNSRSGIPSGTFFREVHPGSEMASRNDTPRSGFLPPALNRAKAQHACVLRPPERGGAGCQLKKRP